jgi:hypothetical protein
MAQGNPAENFMALTSLNRQFVTQVTRPTAGGRNPLIPIPKAGYISALALRIRGAITTDAATNPTQDPGFAGIIRAVRLNTNVVGRLIDITGFGYHYLYRPYIDSGYFDGISAITNFNADLTIAVDATCDISMLLPLALNPLSTRGLFMNQSDRRNVTLEIEWATQADLDTNATPTLAFGAWTADVFWEFFDAPAGAENQPDQSEIHTITEAPLQNQAAAGTVVYTPERSGWFLRIMHEYNGGVGVTADAFSNLDIRINQTLHPYNMANFGWELFHGRYHPTRRQSSVLVDYAAYSGLGMFGVGRDWFPSFSYTQYDHLLTVAAAGNLRSIVDQVLRRKPAA